MTRTRPPSNHSMRLQLALACFLLLTAGPVQTAAATGIVVLDFELRNLTPIPDSAEDLQRAASIRQMLISALQNKVDVRVVTVDPAAARAADAAVGYLFDHSDAAAQLGLAHGADWILVGRLHKPSFLFAYLMARLVDTRSGTVKEDVVVEVKGQQEIVTRKGVERLAEKLTARLSAAVGASGTQSAAH